MRSWYRHAALLPSVPLAGKKLFMMVMMIIIINRNYLKKTLSTLPAVPVNLQLMLLGKEVIRLSQLALKYFYLIVEDFNESSALQTDKMVVVRLAECQLEAGLAAADLDLLSKASLTQEPEVAVYCRRTNRLISLLKDIVEFVNSEMRLCSKKFIKYLLALFCLPQPFACQEFGKNIFCGFDHNDNRYQLCRKVFLLSTVFSQGFSYLIRLKRKSGSMLRVAGSSQTPYPQAGVQRTQVASA